MFFSNNPVKLLSQKTEGPIFSPLQDSLKSQAGTNIDTKAVLAASISVAIPTPPNPHLSLRCCLICLTPSLRPERNQSPKEEVVVVVEEVKFYTCCYSFTTR